MVDPRRVRFERLALPLEKDLYYAALALTRHEADAVDLVQETYLRAYRGFDTYRTDDNIKGWMFRILHNAYIDHCRRRRLEPALAELDSEPVDQPAPPSSSRLEDVLSDDVLRAMQSLSPAHQILIQLADIESLTYQEIADILERPIGSVMSGLHNARTRLRVALEKRRQEAPSAE
ncbi:MAG: sigma-70 family RNA polymerase sigma factor [Planctomycetes bacterium]|nr:sigma-70 family RNA polymerase sigma factor [Planctomycetota bacterium]